MPKKINNIDKFLLNTDYPMDKIIWLFQTQMDLSQAKRGYINMTHEPRPFFVRGIGSVDDWQTSFVLGRNYPFPDNDELVACDWHNKISGVVLPHIIIDASTMTSFSDKVLKLRLWGVQREDIAFAIDYGKTSQRAFPRLILDTDKNYPRLIMDGVARDGETVRHNLGHIPYVDYWEWSDATDTNDPFGENWNYYSTGMLDDDEILPSIRATSETITFRKMQGQSEGQATWYYYRIYG